MLNLSITDQIADLSFVLLFLPDYWVDNFTFNRGEGQRGGKETADFMVADRNGSWAHMQIPYKKILFL